MFGFGKKKKEKESKSVDSAKRVKGKKKRVMRHAGPYTPDQRRQAVEAYLKSGMKAKDFAKTWGTSEASLYNWLKVYEKSGGKGLERSSLSDDAKKRGRKGLPEPVKKEITSVKSENPEFGVKKVRNFLWRFRGVKVSDGTVRKTLKAAGVPPLEPKKRKRAVRKPKVKRFERAQPMQLWQTDITSFVLTRHKQRVYLTVFLDDCSRYIVSWALELQQTKEFVMNTLLDGIQRFGKPEEVLTDQGRQYFSWRGKSEFRKLLRKQGIQHVVARAHHPETVGKCERFWETVGKEFWERVEPQDLNEARERFEQFVRHYNHFRPHQGIDGMVPADRFFGAAQDVRKAIEDTISKNALKLAVGETPRKPVYLIGQIGETPVSLHGEKGKLVIQTPQGTKQHLDYEDFGHGKVVTTNKGEKEDESTNESGYREQGEGQNTAQAEPESEVCDSEGAGISCEGTLGDGNRGATSDSSQNVGSDHGALAGEDHESRTCRAVKDATAPDLAALPASDLGNDCGLACSTEDAITERAKEYGYQSAEENRPRERSESTQEANRGTREESEHAGAIDCSTAGDAGLQRCEHSTGGGGSHTDPGGDECSKSDQENSGSRTDRSSS